MLAILAAALGPILYAAPLALQVLLFALADALRVEYKAIVEAGLHVQIDDAFFPFMQEKLCPPMTLAQYRDWAQLRIDALNRALDGIPLEKSRYHICWGSWSGPHVFDVPLKDIVDIMLQVNVGAYSFEAANVRHEHEWKVWRDVTLPPGTILIPGVVSHSTNVVEHPEVVADRITAAVAAARKAQAAWAQVPLAERAKLCLAAVDALLAMKPEIGPELAWQMGLQYYRDAFLAAAGTQTFRLHFSAKRAIGDDPMIAQMIASFDPN